jgi:hypothetical protein
MLRDNYNQNPSPDKLWALMLSCTSNMMKKYDQLGCSFAVSGTLLHDGKPCLLLDKLVSDGYKVVEFKFDYNKVSRVGKKESKEVLIKNY